MPRKPPISTQSPESEWRWDSSRSIWLQWNESSASWVINHKPLPRWFIDNNGTIPASMFLRLWAKSVSWDELQQQIFWLSVPELQLLAERLTLECRQCGVKPPDMLPTTTVQTTLPVSEWLEEGLVTRIEGAEVSTQVSDQTTPYDPMQALFDAQKNRSEKGLTDSRPFFQTVEQGKFTAKH